MNKTNENQFTHKILWDENFKGRIVVIPNNINVEEIKKTENENINNK